MTGIQAFSATNTLLAHQLSEFAALRDTKETLDRILSDQDSIIRRQQETISALDGTIAAQAQELAVLACRLEREEAHARGLEGQLYGFAQVLLGRDGAVVERRATAWLSDADFNAMRTNGWVCAGIEEDGTMTWLRPLSSS